MHNPLPHTSTQGVDELPCGATSIRLGEYAQPVAKPKHDSERGPDIDPANPADMSFEQALEAIEQTISRIESGEVGLERSIAEYESGMKLIARCREMLEKAEQRIEELTRPQPRSADKSS